MQDSAVEQGSLLVTRAELESGKRRLMRFTSAINADKALLVASAPSWMRYTITGAEDDPHTITASCYYVDGVPISGEPDAFTLPLDCHGGEEDISWIDYAVFPYELHQIALTLSMENGTFVTLKAFDGCWLSEQSSDPLFFRIHCDYESEGVDVVHAQILSDRPRPPAPYSRCNFVVPLSPR